MSDVLEFPALKEAQGKLDAKQKKLAEIFAEAGPDLDMGKVKCLDGDSGAKVEAIRNLNKELDDLGVEVDKLREVGKAARRVRDGNGGGEPGAEPGGRQRAPGDLEDRAQVKSLGDLFVQSKAFKNRSGRIGPEAELDIETKTLFETGNGWAPEVTRTGRVVPFATRPIQVTDLLPTNTTSQSAIAYMEETGFVNNAAETAEGQQFPEAALKLEEKTSPVRNISVWLPMTDMQLEDEPQARGYVNNRLPFMLRQRLDGQILIGNGTAPNLRGILNVSGIQTQAKGADPVPDAVYKAMTKVKVTGRAFPNATVFHPNDWQDVRLLRTADGIYIWGNPSEAGPMRIWGLVVVESDALTENTGLVGDWANYSELTTRRGVVVQVSNSHGGFFIEGKQAVRADMRVAVTFYRPAAFAQVTGI